MMSLAKFLKDALIEIYDARHTARAPVFDLAGLNDIIAAEISVLSVIDSTQELEDKLNATNEELELAKDVIEALDARIKRLEFDVKS